MSDKKEPGQLAFEIFYADSVDFASATGQDLWVRIEATIRELGEKSDNA